MREVGRITLRAASVCIKVIQEKYLRETSIRD